MKNIIIDNIIVAIRYFFGVISNVGIIKIKFDGFRAKNSIKIAKDSNHLTLLLFIFINIAFKIIRF